MSRNGLTSTPGLFGSGNATSNLYVRRGEDINVDTLDADVINTGTLNVLSTGNASLSITGQGSNAIVTSSNVLELVANSSIQLYPSNISEAGIVLTAPSPTKANIGVLGPAVTLFVQGTKPINTISFVGGGSGVAMSAANVGVMNYVTVTSAGVLNLQLAGGGIEAGSTLEFVLNRASLGTVQWSVGGTTLFSFDPATVSAGEAKSVRIFTPDGTAFVVLV